MQRNPSYVFFAWREGLDDAGGPLGAEGVPLTAGRSLAVDRKALPFGAPLWLDTEAPTGPDGALRPFRRLMIAQDTGGAITGAVRGDIFFGTGAAAGEVAGRMSSTGRYAVLLPKGVSVTR
jgi:membrane-bound lytic murein transglycosylase A